jgi:hypothetical protein
MPSVGQAKSACEADAALLPRADGFKPVLCIGLRSRPGLPGDMLTDDGASKLRVTSTFIIDVAM